MAHIDYYLGTISPWCYLAGDRLEQIAARHGAQITYKPRWADHLDMPLNLKPAHWPVNMAPSSYAIIAAQAAGGDVGALVQGFLRAVWAEERDISDDAVIRDILGANGFDPSLADTGLFVGAETYGRNLEQAVAAGAFGAPFYVVRETDQRFWGQDRLDFLDRHLALL